VSQRWGESMRKFGWLIANVLKWSGLALLALTFLAFLLLALAFLINSRDEELTPETRALLVPPPNPFPAMDNIYLTMAGFDAPRGLPVIGVGEARIERYNRELAQAATPAAAKAREFEPQRLQFKCAPELCEFLNGSLWHDVPYHGNDVLSLRRDNWELYQRYLALHLQHGYYETARPSFAAPSYSVPLSVRKLYLADVVLHLRSGDDRARREALNNLRDDMQLWRSVLTGYGGLLSKMLSVGNLEADALLMADVIADPTVPLPDEAADADVVAPLFDLRDWNIGDAFPWEFRMQASVLEQIQEESETGWTARPSKDGLQPSWSRLENRLVGRFYKLRATENLFALSAARLKVSAAADPKTFAARIPPEEKLHLWMLPFTYNPIGKILAGVAVPDSENSSLRAWDGAALQRLLRVSYEIRRQRIDAAKIPAFLAHHPEWSTHPADGRPFVWDPQNLEIRVQTVAQQTPGRRFRIRVWQPASSG